MKEVNFGFSRGLVVWLFRCEQSLLYGCGAKQAIGQLWQRSERGNKNKRLIGCLVKVLGNF